MTSEPEKYKQKCWTKKPPTKSGWYWWRESMAYVGKVIWVSSEGKTVEAFANSRHVRDYGGEWYGPLREPGGDAIENCGGADA